MCTVILDWRPGALVVGANRDERPDRPSSHFEIRDGGEALYPLDVGGGTWIGANDRGLFAALTDRDDVRGIRGRESRGALVMRAMRAGSVAQASAWADELDPRRYSGFRLIVADRSRLAVWESDGSSERVVRAELAEGLHVVTGFGLDTWDVPRCGLIRRVMGETVGEALARSERMKKVLASHSTGRVADDVCVHDPGESHVTVSSCVLESRSSGYLVQAVDAAPCSGAAWDSWIIGRIGQP